MADITHEEHNEVLKAIEESVGKNVQMCYGKDYINISMPAYFLLVCGIEMSGDAAGGFTRKRSLHSWGFKSNSEYIKDAIGAFKLFLAQDKNWGVNDGITWEDGGSSRQIVIAVADGIFDFIIKHPNSTIKVMFNNTMCECDECLTELGSIKAIFKKTWRDLIGKRQ